MTKKATSHHVKTAEEIEQERKKRWGLLDWPELEVVTYPTYFTAVMVYAGTGEGLTCGISMQYALHVDDIRKAIHEHFGPYFAQFAEVALGLKLLPGYKDLVPSMTRRIIHDIKRGVPPSRFVFHAVQYTNYS